MHGQKSMVGYSPWGCQRVRHNLATKQQTKNNNQLVNCHYLPPKLQLAMNNHQKENVGSHQKKIPHIQGQRRSPSKMVKGAKSRLESNPIPARDARRAQTSPLRVPVWVRTRTQRLHRDWARSVFECLLQRYRSAVDFPTGSGSGCSRPGYGIRPLGGGHQ